MIKLHKGSFQHVESELYAWPDTKREIIRLRAEIITGAGREDENVGGSRSSVPGDPTGRTAVLLTSNRLLEQLERVHDAIEAVYNSLPHDKQRLIRLRYWTRSRRLTWDGIAEQLHIGRRTAIRWRDETVREIAQRIGWR